MSENGNENGGYANGNGTPARPASPAQSVFSDGGASTAPPARTSSAKPEEEVNLEYLRNLILQFLEHKEMRVGFPADLLVCILTNETLYVLWM